MAGHAHFMVMREPLFQSGGLSGQRIRCSWGMMTNRARRRVSENSIHDPVVLGSDVDLPTPNHQRGSEDAEDARTKDPNPNSEQEWSAHAEGIGRSLDKPSMRPISATLG